MCLGLLPHLPQCTLGLKAGSEERRLRGSFPPPTPPPPRPNSPGRSSLGPAAARSLLPMEQMNCKCKLQHGEWLLIRSILWLHTLWSPPCRSPCRPRSQGGRSQEGGSVPGGSPFTSSFPPDPTRWGLFLGWTVFQVSFLFFSFLLTFPLTIYKTDFGQKVSCTLPGVQGAILHIWDISKLPDSLCPSSSFYPPNILKPMRTFAVFHIMPPLQTLEALPMLSLLPHSILVQCRLSLL